MLMLVPVCSGPLSSKPVAMLLSDAVDFNLTRMRPSNECHLITHNHISVLQRFFIELVGLTH